MTEIVDERQRLVADLVELRHRLQSGRVPHQHDLDRLADGINALASPSNGNKKGDAHRDGQLLWRTGWANFYNISEPGAGIIVFNTREEASSSGLKERINPEPVWVIVRPSDPDAFSRPPEQPRKATGEAKAISDALALVRLTVDLPHEADDALAAAQKFICRASVSPAAAQGWQTMEAAAVLAEREACAGLCDSMMDDSLKRDAVFFDRGIFGDIARAIRARTPAAAPEQEKGEQT